jgi:hypothetical protein
MSLYLGIAQVICPIGTGDYFFGLKQPGLEGDHSSSPDIKITWVLNPEDKGDMFLRNVGLSQNYTALQHSRMYTS